MNNNSTRRSDLLGKTAGSAIIKYFILAVMVLIVLLPMLIMLNTSFKTPNEYATTAVYYPVRNFLDFGNYIDFIEKGHILRGFKNSLVLVLISVVFSVVMGTMVAYILGRFNFKLKLPILLAFLMSAIIPSVTTQVAVFTVIKGLGLYNSIYAGIVLYSSTDVIQLYIFLQFIAKIPASLDESASVDGASYFRIYRSILLPQLKPAIATCAILKTIWIYNDILVPFLYMPNPELRTITTSLYAFSNSRSSQWSILCAGVITVMIPTLLLYLFLQKYIVAGVTQGAVKS